MRSLYLARSPVVGAKWFGLFVFFAVLLRAAPGLGRQAPAPGKAPRTTSSASFDALVNQAAAAREADRTDEATRLYQEVVRANPDFVEGWWYLGMLDYEADRFTDGQAAFRHVTGLKPEMALGWVMLGLCEFETKKYESALVHLKRADQLGIPRQQDFYEVAKYHLALLLTRSGEFEAATGVIADFVRQGKESPDFTEAMGLAALRKPLLPSELPPLERELVMDVGQAMCDAAARRATAVDADLALLLQKYPRTPQIHFLVGTMLLADDPDRALDQWKQELVISPAHPQALVSLAGEYVKRKQYQTALPYAEKAVAASPNYFAARAVLGEVLTEGDLDLPRGIRELEVAARLAPWQPQVRFVLAAAYAKAGRKEDAMKQRVEFLRLRKQGEVAVSKPQ